MKFIDIMFNKMSLEILLTENLAKRTDSTINAWVGLIQKPYKNNPLVELTTSLMGCCDFQNVGVGNHHTLANFQILQFRLNFRLHHVDRF